MPAGAGRCRAPWQLLWGRDRRPRTGRPGQPQLSPSRETWDAKEGMCKLLSKLGQFEINKHCGKRACHSREITEEKLGTVTLM